MRTRRVREGRERNLESEELNAASNMKMPLFLLLLLLSIGDRGGSAGKERTNGALNVRLCCKAYRLNGFVANPIV